MQIQILIQSPELRIPTQTLILSLSSKDTLCDLKSRILSSEALSLFYFTFNGKPLGDHSSVLSHGLTSFSTLVLRSRCRGGGGDGGSTCAESRDCYLNMYAVKKPDKVDPNEQRLSRWQNCALSNEPLREPCVVDKLGNIFNKEALVQAMLQKNLPKEFGHIKGLKDMVKIELSLTPGGVDANGGTRFQCPISGLEFNGKYKFFSLKKCGHVLSAKALKEVKLSSCLVCHEEFSEEDKIVINGSEEEVTILRERMEKEKGKLKPKKPKKVKNGDIGVNGGDADDFGFSRLSGTKHAIEAKAGEKVSDKVEGHMKVANSNGGTKVVADGGGKRFKAADLAPPNANKEVFASIFTSSKKSGIRETYSCRSLPLGRN